MDYKLIAVDIDGTLFDDKKKISIDNKQTITKALDAGIKVVLSSGRSYDGLIKIANELGIKGPDQYMIELGGNVIENLDRKVIYKKTLENSDCEKIDNFLNQNKVKFELVDTKGNLYSSYQEWMEKRMLEPELGIAKFLTHTHKRDIQKLADLMHKEYDNDFFVVVTSPEDVELFPKYVSKGQAVERLAKHLKINLKQVMAIGDMDNDIPMLKIAGKSVAMSNSPEEVFDVSDEVVPDNNHSGVSVAIERFALQ